MSFKRALALLLGAAICIALTGCGKKEYPARNLTGVIQWGAGGGTDTLMRPLCDLAGEELGVKVVARNVAGGSGSIGLETVYDAKADGYTLLLGAENPALYRELDITEHSYDDFECILLVGDETVGIAVNRDAPYATLEELIADAVARPGKITCATTGKGGLPWQVNALLYAVTGARFNEIPFDSDASARTAVISGECVFTACKLQSGLESWKSGDLKYLCLLTGAEDTRMPGVPPITDTYTEFGSFLPWGPFYGVFVKKGTPDEVVDRLTKGFEKAFAKPSYAQVLQRLCVNPLGLKGAEAREYIDRWSRVTTQALRQSGALDKP